MQRFLQFLGFVKYKYYSISVSISIYFLQTTVLLDEAKIREDARHVQHKCLEKEHVALKEENKKVPRPQSCLLVLSTLICLFISN